MRKTKKSQEKVEVKRSKRRLELVCIIIGMLIASFGGYWGGLKAMQHEANIKVEKAQQEANIKVEKAQQKANAKVEKLEQKLQKEYIEKKYTLLEEEYEIFTLLKQGDTEYCLERISFQNGKWGELGEDALNKLILAEVPYFEDANEEEVLEYVVDTLRKIAEKYPYSLEVNREIIYRLELLDESKEKFQKAQTFETIDRLKKQCEENIALWEI